MLLREWRAGKQEAFDELVPLVYGELHRIAYAHLRGERSNHSFKPGDLVSEVYVRLAQAEDAPELEDRVHFFAIAARTMRNILIDHARARTAAKRGDGARPVTFDEALVAGDERSDELVALDDALKALALLDERKARTLELHYFGGMTQTEIAEALGVHINTIARDLRLAEAWIHRHMSGVAPD
jgi:RNA polymerase sigma-70 factor, ECF subfamily